MFCKKCGARIDDDAQFCEKCGTPVKRIVPVNEVPEEVLVPEEAPASEEVTVPEKVTAPEEATQEEASAPGEGSAPKEATAAEEKSAPEHITEAELPAETIEKEKAKKRKNPLIMAAALVLVVIIAALAYFLKPAQGSVPADPRAQCNYNNFGKMVFDESRLYFVGYADPDEEDCCLYSTSYSGTDQEILSQNSNILMIRMAGDKILYYASGDGKKSIGLMDKDGSNDRTIIEPKETVNDFDLAASKLYYLMGSSLHCCSLDGEDDEILLVNVDNFIIAGKCYYTSADSIYAYDLKTKKSIKICSAEARDLVYADNTLYFEDPSGLYSVPADGSGTKKSLVADSQAGEYTIVDDTIYYVKRFTQDEVEIMAEYLNKDSDDDDQTLYEMVLTGTGEVYSCPVSGGDSVEVNTDPGIIFYLYSYPGGMYYCMGPLSNKVSALTIEK